MYSFDVFDTLITRKTAIPQGIFAMMQRELEQNWEYRNIPSSFRTNFYRLRIEAEKSARYSYQDGQTDDVTLRQIYSVLAMRGELDEKQAEKLMDLECEIEYRESLSVKKNLAWIKELLQKGEKIILISDMYLPGEQIQRMLEKADPVLTTLPLFLSNEYGEGKYTGRLYQRIKKELHLKEEMWIHIGDNQRVDGTAAEKLGIRTQRSWFPDLLPIEQELLKTGGNNVWLSRMIGCSRQARLEMGEKAADKDAVMAGTSAGGILLFSYVNWILNSCCTKNINRLYFIARDGYVLKQIADDVIRRKGMDLKTYYIYGSRRAWRMPSFSERNHDIRKLIDWSHGNRIKCIRDIAEIFQIQTEELREFLTVSIPDDMQEISRHTMETIWKDLQSNDAFITYLIRYHASKRDMVKQYLRQEIDFSDNRFAFVDVSGSGYTQSCLADIIRDFYENPIQTFFFKIDKVNVADYGTNYCFFPIKMNNGVILEMFCRAPEEQTIGYRMRNGKVVPVFMENEKEKLAIIEHGFQDYMAGVRAFVNQVCDNRGYELTEDMEQIHKILTYIAETRDEVFLRFLGDMPNSVTGREKRVITFAPVLTKEQMKEIFWEGRKEAYPNTCLEYSLLRCSREELECIEYYRNRPAPVSMTRDFPFELCCGRIILYGAGKMGQELYQRMQNMKNIIVVQWMDQNAGNDRMDVPVIGTDKLMEESFEKLIIAVWNRTTAKEIQKGLLERGVPAERIYWFHPAKRWMRDRLEEEN